MVIKISKKLNETGDTMKKIIMLALTLIFISGCNVNRNVIESKKTTTSIPFDNLSILVDEFKQNTKSIDLNYYDLDNKRHFSLFEDEFKITLNLDLPKSLKVNEPSIIEYKNQEYISLTISYLPKDCKDDKCSELFYGWDIYPIDFNDTNVQINSLDSPSIQNDYFVIPFEAKNPKLDATSLKEYTDLKNQAKMNILRLVWFR